MLSSPQAYKALKDSELFTLPSGRTLQYYKNDIKQKPGFQNKNLTLMKNQAKLNIVSEYGHHGGRSRTTWSLLILVIAELVGMLDMRPLNNNIRFINACGKKVQMVTHVLQYVFHGFTGFK
jgi:hypothetical protein